MATVQQWWELRPLIGITVCGTVERMDRIPDEERRLSCFGQHQHQVVQVLAHGTLPSPEPRPDHETCRICGSIPHRKYCPFT